MTGDTFGVVERYSLGATDGFTVDVGLVSRDGIPGAGWTGEAD